MYWTCRRRRSSTRSGSTPGACSLLDTEEGRIVGDTELKAGLSNGKPYGQWLKDNRITLEELPEPPYVQGPDLDTLVQRQAAFGYTLEDLRMLIEPKALTGAEPVGSMGNDAPLAALSDQSPLLFNYFKQLFAQVSNPPWTPSERSWSRPSPQPSAPSRTYSMRDPRTAASSELRNRS